MRHAAEPAKHRRPPPSCARHVQGVLAHRLARRLTVDRHRRSSSTGRGDTGAIVADLTDLAIDLGEAARDIGAGAAVFVDEMQHLDGDELAATAQACHEVAQRGLPFFVIGAGLPNLPGVLADARSYTERLFVYLRIDRLSSDDAAIALVRPAAEEGVTWTDEAVTAVVDASGGYPYLLQQFGQTTWNAAAASPIGIADALRRDPRSDVACSTRASSAPAGTGPRPPSGTTSRRWPPTETDRAPPARWRGASGAASHRSDRSAPT